MGQLSHVFMELAGYPPAFALLRSRKVMDQVPEQVHIVLKVERAMGLRQIGHYQAEGRAFGSIFCWHPNRDSHRQLQISANAEERLHIGGGFGCLIQAQSESTLVLG